ncbi:hypothetical protein EYS10_25500 [Rahnella aquatilis]|jgi:hypothetical protein|uniref:hypothetical protein n=1 Tax=Rahnella sp. NRRL B-41462 TaxID=1610579 RepID=UPI000DC38215|nr:hypothetical protein [Rahnella sp. NRRL B-41462]QBJ11689.1 hypothetical protein EYS10_25500 [Rahnella aquatilis]
MIKYLLAILAFIFVWFAGFTVYIAINGFNIVYGGDTAAGVAFLWMASLVAAFCGYAVVKSEEER